MLSQIILGFVFQAIFVITNIESAGTSPFNVHVYFDGSYKISINGVTWLNGGDTAFNADGKTFSTSDDSLKLQGYSSVNGSDQFGDWDATSFRYQAGSLPVIANIKTYSNPNLPVAIFTQVYLATATNTSAGSSERIISNFPTFQLGPQSLDLGFLTFAGDMVGYSAMSIGRFNESAFFHTGLEGGPLVIFDNSSNVLVISPLTQFMAASSSLDIQKQINWGIMGLVDRVPIGYTVDFVVYYSNQGVNQAIQAWGNYLTTLYEKSPDRRDNDPTVQYMGYWTDNGAYYYYNTEEGKNYETTILDTAAYINSLGVPFRYLQFDSWWYPKGKEDGTITWTPMSSILPDGFKYISDMTKLPFGCHNRYWAEDTTYARYNGGQFNFLPDQATGLSVPDDASFWYFLFNQTQSWGQFILYEQDWLDRETSLNIALQTDLFLGQRWLLQMGQAAERFGNINIQYCMSNSRHVLQSLEIPVVTQARVSRDYHPGGHQWDIGISSIFADALYIAPFKDTFWTTVSQPGDPYHNASEPNTRLQALVATLSTGPVGPGDGIGYINKTLLMKCCDASGLILKPAKPATAINDQIKMAAFGFPYPGPEGQVYTTYTVISGFFFGIVLAAELNNDYSLTPTHAWPTIEFPPSLAFSESDHKTLFSFSSSAPIQLGPQCSVKNFCLLYSSPLIQLDSGDSFAILGELDKWVPMSHRRVNSIQTTGTDFIVQIMVQAQESVTFSYYIVSKNLVISVVCDNSKSSTPALSTYISIAKGTCTVD